MSGDDEPWAELRRHTPARIALGRSGSSQRTADWLRFAADHAQARDAVHLPLDEAALRAGLIEDGWPAPLVVHSRAGTRAEYLRRPDLGRRLDASGAAALHACADASVDLALVLGDGLSAAALQAHARPLLRALREALAQRMSIAPPVLALQARVALGDEIGALLQASLVLVLIGERPGLSSPDSLGAYLTHGPAVGCHDAQRNCVSNIRSAGLAPALGAQRLAWLIQASLRRGLSGIALKDDSEATLIADQQ